MVDLSRLRVALVGLILEDGVRLAENHGWTVRVRERDGISMIGTQDYVPNRINVKVHAGKISDVTGIG